jgi:hypothetical protein
MHKFACTNDRCVKYGFKLYQFIRDHGGWENWDMFEFEKFPCKDGNEARCREQHWISLTHAALNTRKSFNASYTLDQQVYNRNYYERSKCFIPDRSIIESGVESLLIHRNRLARVLCQLSL